MENGSSKKVIPSFIYKAFMILLKIFYPYGLSPRCSCWWGCSSSFWRLQVGPLRGRAGFEVKIRIEVTRWFPCENLARRPSPKVKHFGLSEPGGWRACGQRLRVPCASAGCFRNVLRTTEHVLKEFSAGCPALGHLSWARKKGDEKSFSNNINQHIDTNTKVGRP
jgi:hypothetical protein